MHAQKDVVKVEYNNPHKYDLKLNGFLIGLELTRDANLWSQVFDSIKWPTVLVRKVKEKNHAVSMNVCVDCYIILFKNIILTMV